MSHLKIVNKFIMTTINKSFRNNSRKIKDSTIAEKLILYGDEAAPPVRFVMMTASILGVQLDFRNINLFAAENKTEFYKKINPRQKVPALVTQNEYICDSHVISLYLCRKWDPEHILYPEDNLTKAKVDEILFFNSSTLFPIDSDIFTTFFAGSPTSAIKTEDWIKSLDFLENRLNGQPWLAGDRMLICDICAVSTITSMLCLVPLSDHHVRLKQWLNEIEKQPFFEINKRGLERLNKFIEALKSATINPN